MLRDLKRWSRAHPTRLLKGKPGPHIFSKPYALVLVKTLNSRKRNPRMEVLAQLIRDINEVDGIAGRSGYPQQRRDFPNRLGARAEHLTKSINSTLDGCGAIVRLLYPTSEGWVKSWAPADFQVRDMKRKGPRAVLATALCIVDVAWSGLLRRIRACTHCGKWLFTGRKAQQFCSALCREKVFRTSESGRAKRAEYMRRSRARERRMSQEHVKVH